VRTEDLEERSDILAAIEFLNLPSVAEYLAARPANAAAGAQTNLFRSSTNRFGLTPVSRSQPSPGKQWISGGIHAVKAIRRMRSRAARIEWRRTAWPDCAGGSVGLMDITGCGILIVSVGDERHGALLLARAWT
jgi:hypothetical protein